MLTVKPVRTLTTEQEEIVASISAGENTMVKALAGCAKTTTIVESLKPLAPGPRTVLLAFNVKIKKELEEQIAAAGISGNIQVKTLNGLGHGAILAAMGGMALDDRKLWKLGQNAGLKRDDLADVVTLVNKARMNGLVPAGTPGRSLIPDEDWIWEGWANDEDIQPEWIPVARKILRESNTMVAKSHVIDFMDQIYYSTCIAGRYPIYDVTFIDEAQDLSPMNHLQLSKTLASRSQLVVVGDPNQAIYGWRGADSSSMDTMRGLRPIWSDRTLSMTFRCPRLVVERQHGHVPLYQAAPSNLEGNIQTFKEWTLTPDGNTAVLCRNNAPLLKLAFRCIRRGIPINFSGKDIGGQMKRLYAKLAGKTTDYAGVKSKINTFLADPDRDETKVDRYESLLEVLNTNNDVTSAVKFLDQVAGPNAIQLSTGHKAKGLEWTTVYHLEPQLVPSKYAQIAGGPALEQEYNLRYVIETRTRNNLFMIQQDGLL